MPSGRLSPLLLILNPKAGDGKGPVFVDQHVLPLIALHGFSLDRHIVTAAPDNAATEFLAFLREHEKVSRIFLLLAGGDGTLHDVINAVYTAQLGRALQVSIAIIPTGTANALYSSLFPADLATTASAEYKLLSLKAMIAAQEMILPLTITKTSIRSASGAIGPVLYSAIVTSTALHASILYDSEILREQILDLSRFKAAAERNMARWYPGVVKFQPREGGRVTIYDHQSGRFIPFLGDYNDKSEPMMRGPFTYFLSSINVDRLEPTFVISPLHRRIPPREDSMDVIVIRPLRDPTISKEFTKDDQVRFAKKLEAALLAAYKDGAHVDLRYLADGTVHEGARDDTIGSLVEYVRCAGHWHWSNTGAEVGHLCVDGTVVDIEIGGEAVCEIIDPRTLQFGVFV